MLKNIEYYGQEYPPVYNLSNIKIPTLLMYGMNDWLATPKVFTITYKRNITINYSFSECYNIKRTFKRYSKSVSSAI